MRTFFWAFLFWSVYQSIGYFLARHWLRSPKTVFCREAGLIDVTYWQSTWEQRKRARMAVLISWGWPLLGIWVVLAYLIERMRAVDPIGRYGRWILRETV